MRYMDRLKKLAKENDIKVTRTTKKNDLIEILKLKEVEIPVDHHELPEVNPGEEYEHSTIEADDRIAKELNDVKSMFKEATTDFEMKQVMRNMAVLDVKIKESEDDTLITNYLRWKLSRRLIDKKDEYLLNDLEQAVLNDVCVNTVKVPSPGLYAQIGVEYKYRKYFDDTRQKDMYITYVARVVKPEEQIGRDLAWKISQGFHPEAKDYEDEKTLYHRVILVETEWNKYFKEVTL